MTGVLSLMVHAHTPREPPEYVLTNYDAKGALWRNSRLRLLKTDLPPEIVGIDAPKGKAQNFIWLSDDPVRFYITSDKEQPGCLTTMALPGPSGPGDDLLRLLFGRIKKLKVFL